MVVAQPNSAVAGVPADTAEEVVEVAAVDAAGVAEDADRRSH
jgi:hypothetical protein